MIKEKINIPKLLYYIIVCLLLGFVGSLLGGNTDVFNTLNKPPLSPPKILFPIVWTIIYILMGVSYYLVKDSNDNKLKLSFIIQLFINITWPLIFFRLSNYLFALIWLIILFISVLYMVFKFYQENKTAGLIQIPYIIWLLFAFYLNLSIYLLN